MHKHFTFWRQFCLLRCNLLFTSCIISVCLVNLLFVPTCFRPFTYHKGAYQSCLRNLMAQGLMGIRRVHSDRGKMLMTLALVCSMSTSTSQMVDALLKFHLTVIPWSQIVDEWVFAKGRKFAHGVGDIRARDQTTIPVDRQRRSSQWAIGQTVSFSAISVTAHSGLGRDNLWCLQVMFVVWMTCHFDNNLAALNQITNRLLHLDRVIYEFAI